MFQRFTPAALLIGTLLTTSTVALARDHGGNGSGRSERGNRSQSFSGGGRNSTPRGFSGGNRNYGQSFVSPPRYQERRNDGRRYEERREHSRGWRDYDRGYIAPRRGYYNGGLYLDYGAPYGYSYDPGYVPDPGYAPSY